MSTTDEYCIVCGQDGPLRHERKPSEFDVRGETLHFEVPVKVCPRCDTTETEQGVDPAEMAFAEYRRRKKLLTPEQIRKIRERYNLSQKSLATLLGMSEATINRYERGGLQARAHDQAIRACENEEVMRDLLSRHADRLSVRQRRRVEQALKSDHNRHRPIPLDTSKPRHMFVERSCMTGFRLFDYERYAAVVIWLCQHMPLITATSINKLLFYTDFLHYKSEAISLTGTVYRRIQHGPAPAEYGVLRQRMEAGEYIEIQEAVYNNGKTGEEFQPGQRANELDVTFNSRELKVLESVAGYFKDYTPKQISDYSHRESAYQETPDRNFISYEKAATLSLSVSG